MFMIAEKSDQEENSLLQQDGSVEFEERGDV